MDLRRHTRFFIAGVPRSVLAPSGLIFGPPGKDCKLKKVPPLGVAKTGKVSRSQYSGFIGFPLLVVRALRCRARHELREVAHGQAAFRTVHSSLTCYACPSDMSFPAAKVKVLE